MPPVEYFDLDDDCVIWPAVDWDGYGEPVLGLAFPCPCRWVGTQSRALDPQGNTIAVDATVILPEPNDMLGPCPLGSILWHGRIEDLFGTGSGQFVSDLQQTLMQAKTYGATPDYRNRESRNTRGLMRFNGQMPTVTNA